MLVLLRAGAAGATPFAYLPVYNDSTVHVVDVATASLVTTIVLPPGGAGPNAVAVSPSGDRVYVGGGNDGTLYVIDTATNTVATSFTAGAAIRGVAVNALGTRLYLARGDGVNSFVRVLDASTYAVITNIPVGNYPAGIVLSPDGSRLYSANHLGDSVSVVDTATNTVVATIPLPGGSFAVGVELTPSGSTLYVARSATVGPGLVTVIDTATNTVITNVAVAHDPHAVAVNAAGTLAYVACAGGNLTVVDTATNTVVTSAPASGQGVATTPDGTKIYLTARPGGLTILDATTYAIVGTIPALNSAAAGRFIGPVCPDDCDDGNDCTVDACNLITGCGHTNASSGTGCDDDTFCNGADTCDGSGGCTGHAGDPCDGGTECADMCDEALDSCNDAPGAPCTSDGNVCTDDECDGAGACAHAANTDPCDDALFCNGADQCLASACSVHADDPCTSGSECADACDEASDSCNDASGTPCSNDANPCTLDACNGAGACAHPAGNVGATCRGAAGVCDVAETCNGINPACPIDGAQPNGTPCSDGDACTSGDQCTGGACVAATPTICALCETCDSIGGCVPAPQPVCKQPTASGKAKLGIKDGAPDTKDLLTFTWTSGAATTTAELGDPPATHGYALCIYTSPAATLIYKGEAPAGGTCVTSPCWKATGTSGFKYGDKEGTPDGLTKMLLKAGLAGKAKAIVKGKGANLAASLLGMPAPPLAEPVHVQLQSENGTCFEASFSASFSNLPGQYKAKSD